MFPVPSFLELLPVICSLFPLLVSMSIDRKILVNSLPFQEDKKEDAVFSSLLVSVCHAAQTTGGTDN